MVFFVFNGFVFGLCFLLFRFAFSLRDETIGWHVVRWLKEVCAVFFGVFIDFFGSVLKEVCAVFFGVFIDFLGPC